MIICFPQLTIDWSLFIFSQIVAPFLHKVIISALPTSIYLQNSLNQLPNFLSFVVPFTFKHFRYFFIPTLEDILPFGPGRLHSIYRQIGQPFWSAVLTLIQEFTQLLPEFLTLDMFLPIFNICSFSQLTKVQSRYTRWDSTAQSRKPVYVVIPQL